MKTFSEFLSLIIPVYKVENYLRQCIDSALAKNLDSLQIVLVDDGSPDNCPAICDEYAERYKNITVIHKINGGLSSARNAGIGASQGKCIMFMDSDDWWNPRVDMQKVVHVVQQYPDVEMFLMSSLDYIEGDGIYQRNEHTRLSNIPTGSVIDYYKALLVNGNLEVHAATKILKRSFIQNNGLYFIEGITAEDSEWMIRLLRCLTKVMVVNEPIYIYRSGRIGSITNTIGEKNICDILWIVEQSIKWYKNSINNEDIKKLEFCYASYLWFSALGLSAKLPSDIRKRLKDIFGHTNAVCRCSSSFKTKICYILYCVFGYYLTMLVLGQYIRLKNRFVINKTRVKGLV